MTSNSGNHGGDTVASIEFVGSVLDIVQGGKTKGPDPIIMRY